MNSAGQHQPLTIERHAEVVTYLARNNPRAWSAIFRPERYVYDERDERDGYSLDGECSDLINAFLRATDWRTMIFTLRRLVRATERRRKMSIGIRLGDRILYGEAI